MAMLPFEPTPFFRDKDRAFWRLQLLGWSGAFLLRSVSGIVNGQDFPFFIVVLIEAITGFSISTILSVVYNTLIRRTPLVTWSATSLVLALSVLVFAFLQTWVIQLTRPEAVGQTQLFIGYLMYPLTLLGAWSALYYAINFFLQVEEQTDRADKLEAQATSAQLAMLRYQLNPHFLFNTLNSISTLVLLKQTVPANKMLTKLSGFLRHTLITKPGAKVTVAQEVETLQLYLDIERMRFEEKLRTEFRIENDAARGALPSFLLQPLIENAIKYGVSAQEEGARISVSAIVIASRLRLTVSDTGPGLQGQQTPAEALKRRQNSTGVGLANIVERLSQAYGEDHRFDIETPKDGGFTVIIEIPYEMVEDDQLALAPSAPRAALPQNSPTASPVDDNENTTLGHPPTGAPA